MVTRHLRWMSSVDLPDLARAIPAAKGMRPATLAAPLPETDDLLQRILALDFSTYMPGSVLTKVDRASMAHGLEVRPPLLDDAMMDLSFALPSRYKLQARLGQVPAQARGARQDPRRDHRPSQEGVRHPAGELAARAAPRPHRGGRRAARRCSIGASWTATCSAAGTRPTRRNAPTTASRCGRCSCWITGSDATGARPPASTPARRPRQPSDGARGSFEIRKK